MVTSEQPASDIPELLTFSDGIQIVPPSAVDLFCAGLDGNSKETHDAYLDNPILLAQAQERRALASALRTTIDAISKNEVTDEQRVNLLDGLTRFCSADPNNGRILLYLPFQILPDLKERQPKSDALIQSEHAFASMYKTIWLQLLHESDIRANFLDGDVLEAGLGEPERVRKAGHLVPELLQHGILIERDIVDVLTLSDEDEVLRSVTEGLVVSIDRNIVGDEYLHQVRSLSQIKPVIGAVLQQLDTQQIQTTDKLDVPDGLHGIWVQRVFFHLYKELQDVDAHFDSPNLTISKKRIIWEKGRKRESVLTRHSTEVAFRLVSGEIDIEYVVWSVRQEDHKNVRNAFFVQTIREAVRISIDADPKIAKKIVNQIVPIFESIWLDADEVSVDRISEGLNHWVRQGMLSQEDCSFFDIQFPDLAAPFPINLERFSKNEGKFLHEISGKIAESPELSKYFYPVILALGSRVKGYATHGADMDAAIFFKPETPLEKRDEALSLLHDAIPELSKLDTLLEFWTWEENDHLGLQYLPDVAPSIVGAPEIHMLLGGIWVGKSVELNRLRSDITDRYLDLSRFEDQKEDARFQLTHQLELDMLQFRLMHKGYRRFYPSQRPEGTQHSSLIDWGSDFWDEGYRTVASLLFLSRVFLPDITVE